MFKLAVLILQVLSAPPPPIFRNTNNFDAPPPIQIRTPTAPAQIPDPILSPVRQFDGPSDMFTFGNSPRSSIGSFNSDDFPSSPPLSRQGSFDAPPIMPYTDTSPPSVYVANRGGAPNPPSILKNGLNVAPASGPPTTKRVTFDDTKRVREFAPDPVVLDDLLAPGFSGLTVNAKKLTPGVVKTEDTRLATHDSIESTDSDGPAGADDFGDLM